jgi:hypothetical protein
MPRVGFEPTIPVFERAKTVDATVIGPFYLYASQIHVYKSAWPFEISTGTGWWLPQINENEAREIIEMFRVGILLYVVITFDPYRQIQLVRMLATCARGEGVRERKLAAGPCFVCCLSPSLRSLLGSVTSISFLRIEGQGCA